MRTRLPWVPPPPTYFADDRSRVKFSLLEQGPFSGLLQVWQVPVSRNPHSCAHPCAGVPQAADDAPPSSLCPCSLLPDPCTAPLVTAAVILCAQEGTVEEDGGCVFPHQPSLGCPHFPSQSFLPSLCP